MKVLISLLLFLGSTTQAVAQRRLVVVDVETLIPVAGANVVSREGTMTTDSLGHVSVSDSCRSLSFSHVNYESRLINLNEVRDTVFMISKLLNVKEVIVFGHGKKRDYSELQRRLGLDRVEAQLAAAGGSHGMDLVALFNTLFVPKKWRASYRKKQRMKRLKEILDSY